LRLSEGVGLGGTKRAGVKDVKATTEAEVTTGVKGMKNGVR
jgi:hypothetical protein